MKKIRMTACVLILALAVCVLAGCSNKNNTGMADEATTAAQSAPKGQNGRADGQNGTMGETANPAAEKRSAVWTACRESCCVTAASPQNAVIHF